MLSGLDLFSGIGGITLALSRWVRPVAYCENDRYAQGVLLSRMADGSLPVAPIWDDVTTLRGSMLPAGIEIIYGGFPCQDISVAGRRVGLDGKRSGLIREVWRLVDELRPSFLFLENVPAIVNGGLDRVLSALAERRYDARWLCLSAAEMGACHRRDRWWLLAHADKHRELQPERLEQEGRRWPDNGTQALADGAEDAFDQVKRAGEPKRCLGWPSVAPLLRGIHGIPFARYRVKALGLSVVPQVAEEAFARLLGV